MESKELTVSIIQTHIHWEDTPKNLAWFEKWFEKIPAETELILLPEMFNTGFSMNTQHAFDSQSEVVKWLEEQSYKLNKILAGSAMYKQKAETGKIDFFNMFFVCDMTSSARSANKQGFQPIYAKRHLFRMANEHTYYTQGQKKAVLKIKEFNICPLICYDLRFPVWSANTYHAESVLYDLYIYAANWPTPRIRAWDALLPARAIENWAYSIGVNRIGIDGNGIEYCGHSAVYDFKGETLAFLGNQEGILTVTLHKENLEKYRQNFPAYLDSDVFSLD